MTSPRRPGRRPRSLTRVGAWLLAVLAAVGLLVFGAGTASAHTLPDAGNRVRASTPETIIAVGVSEHVRAGQGRGPPGLTSRFVVATGVAAETAPEVSQILLRSPKTLQAKFKHAADFGVTGNYSKANAAKFSEAIHLHINAPGTQAIAGTYRGEAVTHYLDPTTGLNVISRNGEFVSGWRLSPSQLSNVLQHGGLGGG